MDDLTVHEVVFAALTAGWSWPLMLNLRNGELVERRLSHSLGCGSGTDSMKLLFSSLMLLWWRMISVWVLSRSFKRVYKSKEVEGRGNEEKLYERKWGGNTELNKIWRLNYNDNRKKSYFQWNTKVTINTERSHLSTVMESHISSKQQTEIYSGYGQLKPPSFESW